ncbi:MAG: hypothetical protein BECKG1743F_GA0114225_101311, partial [Candidatus Kentron sp. G]
MPKSCGSTTLYYYPAISCFLCTLFNSHFHKVLVRYRSCPAFSIASSDIDSDPEKTTTPVAAWLRYVIRIPSINLESDKSLKEYTNLLVFIVQLLRCNNSYIVHDAPAARLESERKSCAIRYILFCQSPY